MQQEDDLRGLAKVADFMRAISILFVLLNLYWYCYEYWKCSGYSLEIIDRILLNFNRTTGLFHCIVYTKLFSFVFLGLSIFGRKGVKSETITWGKICVLATLGFAFFFLNWFILELPLSLFSKMLLYVITTSFGYLFLLVAGTYLSRLFKNRLLNDSFNVENESFMQEVQRLENEYSINFETKFYFQKKEYRGQISVVNPFRGIGVLGSPGSGKSFAIINAIIRQHIEKGFAMYIYDYKFPDLSVIAYNHLLLHYSSYEIKPKIYIINFDDPHRSHRCNPLNPSFMYDIADAYESAYTILLNLNKSWSDKQGDFFVESPIVLLTAIIWYLKIYKAGEFCSFPHVIEFLNRSYEDIFTILTSYRELENYLSPFLDAWKSGAQDQLQGQIASAKIPRSRVISPALYWVMSGNDFSLDINNPQSPKVLCIGNNPDRQNIYSSALGLYNSRIVKLINKKGQLKCSLIYDEVPTIFFRGLDNLIATARSNRVSVTLGFQDYSQLNKEYGDKESKVIQSILGNIFVGQVTGETAKNLSDRFGKILQKRESITINASDQSSSTSTQLDALIPASKIANLSQGTFVGAVADNYNEHIEQKIFHAEILVNMEKIKQEESRYQDIPIIYDFLDDNGNDIMNDVIQKNYYKIKEDVRLIVVEELKRIKSDPNLRHLLKTED